MIEIVKEKAKKPRRVKPHYVIEFDYMIGDADGDKANKVKVSIDNPYVERFVSLMKSLKAPKGQWGVSINEEDLEKCFNEGQFTKDDHRFLKATCLDNSWGYEPEEDDDFDDLGPNPYVNKDKYINEFHEGCESETEYSFLTLRGVELYHVDETGKRSKTKIKKGKA